MAQAIERHKPDPTIAISIVDRIASSRLSPKLTKHLEYDTHSFFQQLKKLDKHDSGNDIQKLLQLLQLFKAKCFRMPVEHQEQTHSFLDTLLEDLEELDFNVSLYEVTITSALDGYTLNRTTFLITALDTCIKEHSPRRSSSNMKKPEKKNHYQSFYTVINENHTLMRQEIALAQELIENCQVIRSHIGSPDTMPRGLAIDFMLHLCATLQGLELLFSNQQLLNRKIPKYVSDEIQILRETHPEVAQAGEDLHKAIAICHPQKP